MSTRVVRTWTRARTMTGTKPCTRCRRVKPLSDFPRNKRMSRGYDSICRTCRREIGREYRDRNRSAIRARDKQARKRSPERFIYNDMIRRCVNPRRSDFGHYGGKGIAVAPEWRGRGGFERFLAHIGPRPSPRHSVDRIDNDGDYAPGNVRWATQKEQTRNFSRTRLITAFGRTQPLAAWAEELGCASRLISQRIDMLGWDPEDAVSLLPGERRSA